MDADDQGSMVENVKISVAKARGVATKIIIGVLIFCGVGYISSVVTQRQCENAEAQSLAHNQMRDEPFYVIVGDEASLSIFTRIGAKFTLFTVMQTFDAKLGIRRVRRFTWPDGEDVPHVDKGGRTARVSYTRVSLPFLAAVDHSAFYGSLGADAGTSYYLCLFGIPIKVREEISGMS